MASPSNLNEAVENPRSRRVLLAGVVGGLGAWLVSAAQRAMPAEAAAGDPVLAGQSTSAGGLETKLQASTHTGEPVFRAAQIGAGDGLLGVAPHGRGVVGIGHTQNGTGVWAQSLEGDAVFAQTRRGVAVKARTAANGVALLGDGSGPGSIALMAIGPSDLRGRVQMGTLKVDSPGNTPGAPAAGNATLFVRSVAGKAQLAVRFPTGTVQVLATEA